MELIPHHSTHPATPTQPPFTPLFLLLFFFFLTAKALLSISPYISRFVLVLCGGLCTDTPQTTAVSWVYSGCVRIGSIYGVSLYADAKRCLLPSVTGTFLLCIIKWEFYLVRGEKAWSAPTIACYVDELTRFKHVCVLFLGDRHHNRLRRQNPSNVDRQGHRFLL